MRDPGGDHEERGSPDAPGAHDIAGRRDRTLAAAIASGIEAQSQQPLVRVVVGMLTSAALIILLVLPVLSQLLHRLRRPFSRQNIGA